jgi:hypothetical protein
MHPDFSRNISHPVDLDTSPIASSLYRQNLLLENTLRFTDPT